MAGKFRQRLTPFLCQEMLYEYATDQLDPERRAAVDECLRNSSESREILKGINQALAYAEELGKVEPSSEMLEQLRESENALSLGRRYSSWKEWPDVLRWATVCILLVICIAGTVSVIPWKRLTAIGPRGTSDSIEIAAVPNPNAQQIFANTEVPPGESAPESSGDEEMEESGDAGDEGEVAASAPPPKTVNSPTATVANQPKSTPTATVQLEPTPAPTHKKEAKAQSFVYRAFMTLGDLENVGDKITNEIEQLGGKKAGDVELGWKRGTGRYYHFAIGETNEEKLLDRLRAYGPVRISKDPHPRVMPAGQVRFILWIESGS